MAFLLPPENVTGLQKIVFTVTEVRIDTQSCYVSYLV